MPISPILLPAIHRLRDDAHLMPSIDTARYGVMPHEKRDDAMMRATFYAAEAATLSIEAPQCDARRRARAERASEAEEIQSARERRRQTVTLRGEAARCAECHRREREATACCFSIAVTIIFRLLFAYIIHSSLPLPITPFSFLLLSFLPLLRLAHCSLVAMLMQGAAQCHAERSRRDTYEGASAPRVEAGRRRACASAVPPDGSKERGKE